MKYMGSKNRLSKDILPILEKYYNDEGCKQYIETCVGGANLIDKVSFSEALFGYDNNHYLIEMWKHLQKTNGVDLPRIISREFYNEVRTSYNTKNGLYPDYLIGWVGFMASYNGRFFDGGYSGHCVGKTQRDYIDEQIRNTLSQVDSIKNIIFGTKSILDIEPSEIKTLFYCDIPYRDTKQYSTSINFDYEGFYDWCKDMKDNGHVVIISEYNMPEPFEMIWSKELNNNLAHNNVSDKKINIEKLYKI